MTDLTLEKRLEMLSETLGQGVRLSEHIDGDDESHPLNGEMNGTGPSETAVDPWGQSATWPSEADLAAKRLEAEKQARDREMAAKKRRAFDCSDFKPGEPLGQEFEFCPLKVILTYHERFVGKANRPRVCFNLR